MNEPACSTGDECDVPACPECGRPSLCMRRNGCETCWCARYPRVLPVPANPDAACLCEECLQRRIAAATPPVA